MTDVWGKNTDRRPGTNTGHGHVWPRPDRKRARCGGPGLCQQCRADTGRWEMTYQERDTNEQQH